MKMCFLLLCMLSLILHVTSANRLIKQLFKEIEQRLNFGKFGKNVGSDECTDQYDMIGECWTKIHVCYGFYDWHWKYYGTASANGTTGPTTPHYDSSIGAGSHAVFLLFQKLPTGTNTCNCGFVNDYVVGACHMDIKECFNFNTSTDVENKKSDYFAWVHLVDDTTAAHTGYFCCDYNQNVTATNAIKDLQQKDPACFV
eukprot:UN00930